MSEPLRAPFPWFGGKRTVIDLVWERLGSPKQYIEPFFGSGAMLLGKEDPASLEVVGDLNGFLANFWRCVKTQPEAVAEWADYPVSHVDLGARHVWLMEQREYLGAELQDPNWPGSPKIAGWWLWGQCCWIGSGWCDWFKEAKGQIPHVSNAGRGVQAKGQIPHVSNAGRGVQAKGKIPHVSDAGRGYITTAGLTSHEWLRKISGRLERCRIVHGAWDRCLNNHYGGKKTAVFLDPPYAGTEEVYGDAKSVSKQVGGWCRENQNLRIALCGLEGEHDLPGWEVVEWSRGNFTYSGNKTTDSERIWFSPACHKPRITGQVDLFGGAA